MDLYTALWSPIPLAIIADLAEEQEMPAHWCDGLRRAGELLACDLINESPHRARWTEAESAAVFWLQSVQLWCQAGGCELKTGVADADGIIRGPGYIIV